MSGDEEILEWCPVCNLRPADASVRPDVHGKHWCKECIDEFDSIDWDAEYDKRQYGD